MIAAQYDLRLVSLAACLCIIACLASVALLTRSRAASSRTAFVWIVVAAALFGGGAWSLHFVAMLAYMPELNVDYDPTTTAVSILIAIIGATVSFWLWNLRRLNRLGATLGGITLGLSMSSMHFTGVAAMRLAGTVTLKKEYVAASVLVAILFGFLALARAHDLASVARRVEIAVWLALCVCSVHFVGMAAVVITMGTPLRMGRAMLDAEEMSVAVGSVSFAVLLLSLGSAIMEQHLATLAGKDLSRMRKLSSLSHEVVIISRNGIVLEVNAAGEQLFGMPLEHLLGSHLLNLFVSKDVPIAPTAACWDLSALGTNELIARAGSGKQFPVEYTSSEIDYNGEPAMALNLRDMSQRRLQEDRILHLAQHDALTDLPNRLLLKQRLGHTLASGRRDGSNVSILYLDLDGFKGVNDAFGHACGDALLIQVGKRLLSVIRSPDTLARIGGDEFVIVSDLAKDPQGAAVLAGRIIDTFDRPFDILDRQLEIGVSIGIALYPADGDTQDALIHAADTALYRAKNEKRGTFRFYEATMHDNLQDHYSLAQDLRHAADRGQLELHYQPVVSASKLTTDGFEALVRWRHPERGLIAPGDFIPLAEETGVINQIGAWVIKSACCAAAAWTDRRWVTVNVSALQLRHSDLPHVIADALAKSGLEAVRLGIEVTESVFIKDSKQAIKVLTAIRDLGVNTSLDDFGTGYSSLSYLRSFAFNRIKIDRSFITGLGQSDETAAIVRAIIGLGHNLGMVVVAEGIETPRQLSILQAEGCDFVQGFLLGAPRRHPTPWTGGAGSRRMRGGVSVVRLPIKPSGNAAA